MELKGFKEYNFADLSETELKNITELENNMRTNTKKDIVLIAYEYEDKAKS